MADESITRPTDSITEAAVVGLVGRMEDHRLPKITLFRELSVGHRSRGASKKRFKESSAATATSRFFFLLLFSSKQALRSFLKELTA